VLVDVAPEQGRISVIGVVDGLASGGKLGRLARDHDVGAARPFVVDLGRKLARLGEREIGADGRLLDRLPCGLVETTKGELGALAVDAEPERPRFRTSRLDDEIEPAPAAVGDLTPLGALLESPD
jgi:hypothetical protein